MLLTNTQVLRLRKTFSNKSSSNIKLSKTQLHKIGLSGGLLGRHLGPLLKTGLPFIGNVFKPLAISNLRFGCGTTTLLISNEEMNDITKIVKSIEECGLLIKVVSEIIKNEAKEQKEGLRRMSLDTLGDSLLGNLLTGKGAITTGEDTIFNATSSFDWFWNIKVSKQT